MFSSLLKSWLKKTPSRNRAKVRPNRLNRLTLRFEPLEDRVTPAIITVTSLSDNLEADRQVTLREAIQAANTDKSVDGSTAGSGADTIVFSNSLLTASGNGFINTKKNGTLTIRSDLTIQGLSNMFIKVRGNDLPSGAISPGTTNNASVFTIVSCTVALQNLVIVNGRASQGGGIYATNSKVSIDNCNIANNTSLDGNGGGIFFSNDKPYVRDAIGNPVYDYVVDPAAGYASIAVPVPTTNTLTITNSFVKGNSSTVRDGSNQAAVGGGISINNGSLYLYNTKVKDNSVLGGNGGQLSASFNGGDADGGGIYASNNGDAFVKQYVSITNGSQIINNSVTGGKGGTKGFTASGAFGTAVDRGGDGGKGGSASGGGITFRNDPYSGIYGLLVLNVEDSLVNDNTAQGGKGGDAKTPQALYEVYKMKVRGVWFGEDDMFKLPYFPINQGQNGGQGGAAFGAGISFDSGSRASKLGDVTIRGVQVTRNSPSGRGNSASGRGNSASGGAGGAGASAGSYFFKNSSHEQQYGHSTGGNGGAGGNADGGGIRATGANVTIANYTKVSSNTVRGGDGGAAGAGATDVNAKDRNNTPRGILYGPGIWVNLPGDGQKGGQGGNGGGAYGAGVSLGSSVYSLPLISVADTTLATNRAVGGDGGAGGAGGNGANQVTEFLDKIPGTSGGQGGGGGGGGPVQGSALNIFNYAAGVKLTNLTADHNVSAGGNGGSGGIGGNGGAGVAKESTAFTVTFEILGFVPVLGAATAYASDIYAKTAASPGNRGGAGGYGGWGGSVTAAVDVRAKSLAMTSSRVDHNVGIGGLGNAGGNGGNGGNGGDSKPGGNPGIGGPTGIGGSAYGGGLRTNLVSDGNTVTASTFTNNVIFGGIHAGSGLRGKDGATINIPATNWIIDTAMFGMGLLFEGVGHVAEKSLSKLYQFAFNLELKIVGEAAGKIADKTKDFLDNLSDAPDAASLVQGSGIFSGYKGTPQPVAGLDGYSAGGGIFISGGNLTLINDTIARNSASLAAGLFVEPTGRQGQVAIGNTVIGDNTNTFNEFFYPLETPGSPVSVNRELVYPYNPQWGVSPVGYPVIAYAGQTNERGWLTGERLQSNNPPPGSIVRLESTNGRGTGAIAAVVQIVVSSRIVPALILISGGVGYDQPPEIYINNKSYGVMSPWEGYIKLPLPDLVDRGNKIISLGNNFISVNDPLSRAFIPASNPPGISGNNREIDTVGSGDLGKTGYSKSSVNPEFTTDANEFVVPSSTSPLLRGGSNRLASQYGLTIDQSIVPSNSTVNVGAFGVTPVTSNPPTISISLPLDRAQYKAATWAGSITGTASVGVYQVAVTIQQNSTGLSWNGTSFVAGGSVLANVQAVAGTVNWSVNFPAAYFPSSSDYYTITALATDKTGKATNASVQFDYAETKSASFIRPDEMKITQPQSLHDIRMRGSITSRYSYPVWDKNEILTATIYGPTGKLSSFSIPIDYQGNFDQFVNVGEMPVGLYKIQYSYLGNNIVNGSKVSADLAITKRTSFFDFNGRVKDYSGVPYGTDAVTVHGAIYDQRYPYYRDPIGSAPDGGRVTISVAGITVHSTIQTVIRNSSSGQGTYGDRGYFQAIIPISTLAPGTYQITIHYDGDAEWEAADDSSQTLTIAERKVTKTTPVTTSLVTASGSRVTVRNSEGNSTKTLDPFPGFLGGVSVASTDVNGDGVFDVVVGAGAGGGPQVKVIDGATGKELASFFAFDLGFTGGVNLAAANGQIVVGAGPGGGPQVKVFDGAIGKELASFFAFDLGFTGGVSVGFTDVNDDGVPDVVVGAGAGGGPHVKVFDGATREVLTSFFAFDLGFTGGVNVAAVNGLIAVGAGPGGGPQVKVFNGTTGKEVTSIFPFDLGFTGGVNVGFTDVNRDGLPDLITAAGPGGGPHVKAFSLLSFTEIESDFVSSLSDTRGVEV